MLKVWGRRNSFNVQKVMWTLGELGLAHRHSDAGGSFGGLDQPDFLAMNPHGRVPVIDDGGVVLWESHSIVRYLAARYGLGQLSAKDLGERGRQERWMDWMLTTLQRDFMDLFWGYYRTPEPQRDWPTIGVRIARCTDHFRLLDRVLATRAYLEGEKLSIADIAVGTALYRYFELDIERPSVPRVEGWYAGLRERLAYRTHVMIPFDDLRGRLAY